MLDSCFVACSSDFISYYDYLNDNSKCLRFNSGFNPVLNRFNSSLLKVSKLTGPMNGLRLYIQTKDIILIQIHNYSNYRFNEFVNIAPGYSTNIAIVETKTEDKLAGKYNDCFDFKSTSIESLINITDYIDVL